MYTKYFGLNEKPFTLTPNPRFIFLSKNHKEAFAHLLYGINNHYGFIELIGEVGTGKTTVLRTLLNQLQEENYRTALIFNPCLTGVELLRSISHEFGLNSQSEYANELLVDLNRFLLAETTSGRTVVLVIDESQNLEPAVLEQIRLISNLETENDKLIQIILAGQPELGTLLERPELRQLNQRIAVRYRLKSMSMNETRAYIRHRMEVAGDTGGVSFSLFAVRWIYLYTRGVPRMINILCDRSLLIAYGDERRRITGGIVTRAIREILNVPQGKRLSQILTGIICAAVISVAIFVGFNKIKQNANKPESVSRSPVVSAPVVTTVSPATPSAKTKPEPTGAINKSTEDPLLKLKQEILSYDQNDMHTLAFNEIAERWGVRPIKIFGGQLTVPHMYKRLAAKRNLQVTEFKGTLDEVIRLNLPALVMTKVTGSLGGYCLAVTGIKNNLVTVSPPLFDSSTLSKTDLNAIASGTYYLVWQNYGQIPDKIKLGDKRFEIRTLQQLLKQAGFYGEAIDGNYSTATAKAVSDFQRSVGIPRNESVGELTLAVLVKFYTSHSAPSLTVTGSSK
jgi:general secretion pathway protein A